MMELEKPKEPQEAREDNDLLDWMLCIDFIPNRRTKDSKSLQRLLEGISYE